MKSINKTNAKPNEGGQKNSPHLSKSLQQAHRKHEEGNHAPRREEEIVQLAKFPSENPNPVMRLDHDGTILYANEAGWNILDNWGCVVGERAPKPWRDTIFEALDKQSNKVVETQCGDKVYSLHVVPVMDANYVNFYGTDETERKRTEDELHASESTLRTLFEAMPDVILILDKNGCYLKIVPSNPRLLFKPADEIIGKTLHEIFPKEDADLFLSQIHVSLDTNQTVHFEYPLPIHEQITWFSASISPITDTSIMWVARDITEKKQAEALQEAVYRIASATETTHSLDELYPQIHQIILSVMPAESFYITLYDELHNTLQFPYNTDTIDKPFVEQVQGGKGITTYVLKTGKSLLCTKAVHEELERRGEVMFVGVPAAIWLGVPLIIEGKAIGVMVAQDYTNPNAYTEREQHMLEFVSTQVAIAITRKQAEYALENSEAELRALFEAMTDVVIVYDREGRYIKIAPTDPGMLIEPPEQLIGKSMYDVFPKPEADRLIQVIQTVLETGKKLDTEYSLQIGEHKTYFACTISPMQTDSVILVAHDITNRKRAEKIQEVMYAISRAAISTESIDELYDSIHKFLGELIHVENFYIALFDPSSDLITFPYYLDQFDEPPSATKPGHGLTEYIMRNGQSLLAPRLIFDQLLQKGEIETVGTISVDWLGVPLKVEGQVIGAMVTQSYQENIRFNEEDLRLFEFVSTQVAQMIDRKRVEEKIHYMGIHDALTGLYNRAYFDEELVRLEHGRQFPISVLMADMDHLKDVNDLEGHAAGDELLKQAAKALRAAFRVEDVVARIGGDEFAVLLPGIDARMAEKAKQRITDNIKMQNTLRNGKPFQISMGAGIAEKGDSLVEALKLADKQMYAEKQSKRKSA
jgi:diguanylate cyclase (GGDEF)-like protein/PAS domain S-box-containing protein